MRQRTILITSVFCCFLLAELSHVGKAQTSSASTAVGGEMLGMGGGNVYVAKPVSGLANFRMIVKKSTATGADTPIGTQQNGHYLISNPAEIPAFEAATGLHVVTSQEMASGILSHPAAGQAQAPAVSAAQPATQNPSGPNDGTASDLGNGTVRVTFTTGKYAGDTIDFTQNGNDVLLKNGGELKGEAKYGGGNHGAGKTGANVLKGLGSVAWHTSNEGAATLDQGNNWTITTYMNGRPGASVNTENAGAGKQSGSLGYA